MSSSFGLGLPPGGTRDDAPGFAPPGPTPTPKGGVTWGGAPVAGRALAALLLGAAEADGAALAMGADTPALSRGSPVVVDGDGDVTAPTEAAAPPAGPAVAVTGRSGAPTADCRSSTTPTVPSTTTLATATTATHTTSTPLFFGS